MIDRREDGTPVTVAEKVIELTRTVWAPWQYIASLAGVTRATMETWRKQGAEARAKIARGEKVTANQRAYAEFLGNLERADAQAVADRLAIVKGAADGGWVKTKTVVKTKDGEVVEEVTTTETAAPEWTAAAWQMERRRPAEFGRRVEVIDAERAYALSKDERAENLAGELEAYLEGHADAKADQHVEAP